jgi:peptidoglycan-N-acetylglucosamine deacetylase
MPGADSYALLSLAAASCGGCVAAAAYATFWPRAGIWCPVIWKGPSGGTPRVALTFDDGPWPAGTEAILNLLDEAGIKAAFFMIGANVARWPALAAEVHHRGHLVGNHSFDHSHQGARRWIPYWTDQLVRTDEAIADAAGVRPALFRPPMGFKTPHVAIAARRTGHTIVTWTRRAMDGVPTTAARISRRLSAAAQGDILALHDGLEARGRREPGATIEALPAVLQGLRERGLETCRLDHLLGVRPYQACPTVRSGPSASAVQVG